MKTVVSIIWQGKVLVGCLKEKERKGLSGNFNLQKTLYYRDYYLENFLEYKSRGGLKVVFSGVYEEIFIGSYSFGVIGALPYGRKVQLSYKNKAIDSYKKKKGIS